jgi:hypothetical protein
MVVLPRDVFELKTRLGLPNIFQDICMPHSVNCSVTII